jgi:acyl-CoA synthetase (NDP forming)
MSAIVARDIVHAYRSAKKPVIVIWGSPVTDDEGWRILVEGRVPMFRSFTACAAGVRRYLDYWRFQESFASQQMTPPRIPTGIRTLLAGSGPLSEVDSITVCSHFGLPFPQSTLCAIEEQAIEAARRFGGRVAMKACGAGIQHKSEHDLVRVGVGPEDVPAAFRQLEQRGRTLAGGAGYEGVLVQALAEEGVEVIVGVKSDPQFGPVVLFGLGGVFVEVLRDVSLRLAPVTAADAQEMIREVRAFPLLDGARGRAKADVAALAGLIVNVSRLATDLRERVAELDLNPVRVLPDGRGVVALDALVVRR